MSEQHDRSTADQKRRLLAKLLQDRHRKEFRTLSEMTYLNFGVQGVLSAGALDAITAHFSRLNRYGPYSMDAILDDREQRQKVRTVLSEELGAPPRWISLVENTSTGCNAVLWGLPWKAGDRLIVTNHEYPGVLAAVSTVSRRFAVEVVEWNVDGTQQEILDRLAALLTPSTRLVVLSHILWDSGRILPLEEIAALCRGFAGGTVRTLVDGAQSAGVLPLNLSAMGVDFFAFTGHKWMCGPEGAGGLYVRPEVFFEQRPTFVGPRSLVFDPSEGFGDFHGDAQRYEVSSISLALHAGLRAAIEVRRKWGAQDACLRRIRDLSRKLWEGMVRLAPQGVRCLQQEPPDAGLVLFRVDGILPLDLVRGLEARRVMVRTIPGTSHLRASVHYLTVEEELDKLLDELGDLIARLRRKA